MSANLDACFSSRETEWSTPQHLFDQLNAEFGPFDLDAAASEYNHKCLAYYDKNTDALSVEEWNGKRIWLNPPYGRDLGKWVEKAEEQAHIYGKLIVLLLPARTDTRWWHKYVEDDAEEVRFIKGRLKFGGAKSSAPFPSVIVVFDGAGYAGLQDWMLRG